MFSLRLKGWLVGFLTKYVFCFLIAYFLFYPDAAKYYEGFFDGLIIGGIHGGLAIPNKIISLYDGRLIMAQSCSTFYTVVWWLSLISSLIDDIYRFWKSFWGNSLD